MDKRIIAIGGGELRSKSTLYIDAYIAKLAKAHASGNRAYGLFIGTASHDSMPYFNSFRKTYTSEFDIKADCALTVYGEMDKQKIEGKFQKADFLYIGGGNTVFMLNHWKTSGLDKLVLDAYSRGIIICGLSAGAIFHFEKMYTDSEKMLDETVDYKLYPAMGTLKGACCPHYNERAADFEAAMIENSIAFAYGIENDCAVSFVNGELVGSISQNNNAYLLRNNCGTVEKYQIEKLDG